MQLVRTTVRLTPEIRKLAKTLALEENTTLQNIISRALQSYIKYLAKKKAK